MGERASEDGRTAVYRFFDGHGVLLYVGMTEDPTRRFSRHTEKPWWGQVDPTRTTITWYPMRDMATAAEREAIRSEKPACNIRHALTLEQEEMLAAAAALAREGRERAQRYQAMIWDAALAARRAGVPDDLLCDETGLSRATLNRRFGNRKAIEQEASTDE